MTIHKAIAHLEARYQREASRDREVTFKLRTRLRAAHAPAEAFEALDRLRERFLARDRARYDALVRLKARVERNIEAARTSILRLEARFEREAEVRRLALFRIKRRFLEVTGREAW